MSDEALLQVPLQGSEQFLEKEATLMVLGFARLQANLKGWNSHALKEPAYDKTINGRVLNKTVLISDHELTSST